MLIAAIIVATVTCGSPDDMLPSVYKAGERHVLKIELPQGSIQMFASKTGTRSWTVFLSTPNGNLCAVAMGTGYKSDKEAGHVPN